MFSIYFFSSYHVPIFFLCKNNYIISLIKKISGKKTYSFLFFGLAKPMILFDILFLKNFNRRLNKLHRFFIRAMRVLNLHYQFTKLILIYKQNFCHMSIRKKTLNFIYEINFKIHSLISLDQKTSR